MNKVAPLPPIKSISATVNTPPSGFSAQSIVPRLNLYGSVSLFPGVAPVDIYDDRGQLLSGRYSAKGDISVSSHLVPVSKSTFKVVLKVLLIATLTVMFVGMIGSAITIGVMFSMKQGANSSTSGYSSYTSTQTTPTVTSAAVPGGCGAGELQCHTGKCIPGYLQCDVFWDCPGGEDELGCDCSQLFACPDGSCIFNSWRCDMDNDCGDFADEVGCVCPGASCVSNGVCIEETAVCDGIQHCADASDEVNCSCSDLETQCHDGSCILTSWMCDGIKDCPDGEDEDNQLCGVSCAAGSTFECVDHRSCVSLLQRCDGMPQCQDGSDELQCVTLNLDTGILYSVLSGTTLPVCSDGWNSQWNNLVCSQLGYGSANGSSFALLESAAGFAVVKLGINPTNNILDLLTYKSNCSSGSVLSLTCQHNECGTRAKEFQETAMVAKILHGDAALPGYWPWQVSLQYLGSHVCGGTLLSDLWVVTAAHCVEFDPSSPQRFKLRLGTSKVTQWTSSMQEVDAKRIYMHPSYNGVTLENDIALVEMDVPVISDSFVRPACIPDNFRFSSSLECYTTGWGGLDHKAKFYPEDLQEARMVLINDTTCQADPNIAEWGIYEDIMLCAGYSNGYVTVCKGDSGGPLMCRDPVLNTWGLVGVVSWGPVSGDIKCMGISVYTEVQAYVQWIRSFVNLH